MIHSINHDKWSQSAFPNLNSNMEQFRRSSAIILSLVQTIDNHDFNSKRLS
jgi:hypothetical protein